MITYWIFASGNTDLNKGDRDFFLIDANDEKEARRKFKKEYPDWIPDDFDAVFASISEELADVLKNDNDPVLIEALQSAVKTYGEATEPDVMMNTVNFVKGLLKNKLHGCPALKHMFEGDYTGKFMTDIEEALKKTNFK